MKTSEAVENPTITLLGGTLDGHAFPAKSSEPSRFVTLTENTDIHYEACGCLVDDPDEADVEVLKVLDPFELAHTYRRSHRDLVSGNWIFIPKDVS